MKQANAAVIGMTRNPDAITSIRAAETVQKRKTTIRQRVIQYALTRPHGFTDEDLFDFATRIALDLNEPLPPESSYRKRRTELCGENLILATEEMKKNSSNQDCTVFYHREFMMNPPPIRAQERKPSKLALLAEENATLRANNAQLCAEIERLRARHG